MIKNQLRPILVSDIAHLTRRIYSLIVAFMTHAFSLFLAHHKVIYQKRIEDFVVLKYAEPNNM